MKTNKTLYRIFILTAFVGVLSLTIFGISQLLAFLKTGADKGNIFHKDAVRHNYYAPTVTWVDSQNPGRPIELNTQAQIERDYMDAVYLQNFALGSLNTDGIEDVFTKKARQNLLDIIEANRKSNTTIERTTLSHQLSLDFYSADGQLVVLTDRNVTSYSRVLINGALIDEISESSDYKILLLLEDGFWKIRHLEKLATAKTSETKYSTTAKLPHKIAGINYYPKDTPWDTFGSAFSQEIIAEDFSIIRDLGLNTVRIFIGYEDFGNAEVLTSKVTKLIQLLAIAEENELSVIITLFDFYGEYSVLDWTRTQQHAIQLVNKVKNHNALLAWDVKNEPNLDYNSRGESLVKAWLKQMIKVIKLEDPLHPVTIGWSNHHAATDLEEQVDFVSFHFYNNIEELPAAVEEIKTQTDKTIVLQEFGMSTYNGFWNPLGNSEQNQKDYYQSFFENQKRDSLNYLSWTLYDFSDIPNQVVKRYPWRTNKQMSFGLINISGTKKSAFEVFKNY